MKLISNQQEKLVFRCSHNEASLLLHLVDLFPLVPLAHHRLSRTPGGIPEPEENQQLLEDSLKAERREKMNWIKSLIGEKSRFRPLKEAVHFTVTREEFETLLQVLNDVRVGSWLTLGSPELGQEEKLVLQPENVVHVHRMELAGLLQMTFLKAIQKES